MTGGGRAFARRGINVCVWPHSVFAGGPTGLALRTVFRLLLGGYVEDHWTQDGPEKTGEQKQTDGWMDGRGDIGQDRKREKGRSKGVRDKTRMKVTKLDAGSLKMAARCRNC